MSSNPQGGPAMPLVGVDLDSDVVSRPRDPYQERKKAFLKPYVEVTSVPVHPVVNYQLPQYKTKVVHVRPWKAPEPKSPRGIEPSTRVPKSHNNFSQSHSPVGDPSEQGHNKDQTFKISGPGPSEQGHKDQSFKISGPGPSEQGHNKDQTFKISVPGPSEQGHNKQQAYKISGPGPSKQGHNKQQAFKISGSGLSEQGHKQQAFKISGPLPYEDYDFVDETYSGEDESDYEFYDDEYYDEQSRDGDFPRFVDQSPFREFRNNDRPLDEFTHSSSSHERYRLFDFTRDDFFQDDHPSRRYPPPSHLRRDEDDPPPGIKKIIGHIRRNVHDQVVKEPEIASLLGKLLPNGTLKDQGDDYPDNIQEIKEIINHPKYPLDYYRSRIPARGDHKSLHRQRGPPFRFP